MGYMDRQELQKELFKEWQIAGEKLKNLSGYFQNDFDRMIEDSLTPKAELKNQAEEFLKEYWTCIEKFHGLALKVSTCMTLRGEGRR